ncbi:MAG TPA: nucleoside hydrolase [Terriglobia bacterium]|nr:nucleoside hydrolase [Terriglobia bacterium]
MKSMTALLAAILLTACFCGAADTPAKIPVILDTDIGTDIDDAFALALIINSPEFELLGVTTVSGDTAARARIAAKMLWEAGGKWQQVPVVAGVPGPKQDINQAPWANDFVGPQILKESAVDFLRGKFHRYPGQVTLIAIGELTNVAALIKADPLAAKKIKRIALMGGSIARGYEPGSKPDAEWNIKSNPAAAQVVFSSGIPITMAPLDVTAMLKLDAAARSRIFNQNTPVPNSLAALYRLWNLETPTLFDPMAVALVLDPALCQTKDLAVEVDDKGFTRVVDGKTSNTTVGLSTNPDRFFEFYLSRVAGK